MEDEAHRRGDENCQLCRRYYPQPCECGGLVHADRGCIITTQCDKCTNPRPVTESEEK
jgi:hypothetical protein